MIALQVLFWLCVGAMVHTYLLYPLSLQLFRRRFAVPPTVQPGAWPTVAVLTPAYNEEQVIAAKVANALALDYPSDKLEVLVGSDGSTDRTNEIVRSIHDPRLRLIELPGRSGKSGVYNRLVQETRADILVFTDANVMLDPAALRNAVRHFADPKVGVVGGGKYILIPEGAESVRGEATYGGFENRLRTRESEVGGMSGALGSFMAVRRNVYRSYRPGSINDDTVPSIWAALAGYRNVHEPDARAFEESGRTVSEEFRRRIRIGAGNFQTLFRYRNVLNPRYGVVAYTYFSHKVLRWVFPFFMLAAFVVNLFLLHDPFYRVIFWAQVLFYGVAVLGFLLDRLQMRVPLVSTVYHFTALNLALFIGFFVYCRGVTTSAWEPTKHETSP
ncbi:glycosyltransferase family 2 protein [bacterium]|nr:glycosyltransferase family 2 protein [bacterium]MBU1984814.1 glycosyltransferase family 2 protein [bacterium]